MKKSLLIMTLVLLSFASKAQVIFYVQSPLSLEGNYSFSYAEPGGWGVPDMTDPANAITDTLVMLDPVDDSACTPLTNSPNVAGQIAVLYRGDCEFGTKALNAQAAGAVAVVVINHSSGTIAMGGGTDGPNVTIPVVMISDADGAILRDSIIGGTVTAFIGSKTGFYADDLGFYNKHVLRAKNFSNVAAVCQNASEFSVDVGTWIYNYGSNPQTGITVTADISFGGASIYSQTSNPFSLAGVDPVTSAVDSVLISFPAFSQSSYQNGYYSMTYTVNYGATDQFIDDNSRTADFMIHDTEASYCPVDSLTGNPVNTNSYRAVDAGATDQQQFCINYSNPNASRLGVRGLSFSAALSSTSMSSIIGEFVEIYAYSWDDSFTGISDANFNISALTEVGYGEYTYNDDLSDSVVFAPFDQAFALLDNQRYLFCVTTLSPELYVGVNTNVDYEENQRIYDQPISPVYGTSSTGAATWFSLGFGTDVVPAITIRTMDAAAVGVEEEENKNISVTPYPNPAVDYVSIPLGNIEGDATINIFDMAGKLVATQSLNIVSNEVSKVNVTNIPSGTYMFKLQLDNGNTTTFNVVVNK